MIKNLKEGKKKKMTISKRIVNGTIEQLKDALEEKTIKNKFKHYRKIPKDIETKFLETIQSTIMIHIKKFIRFLTDEYLDNCRDTIGLCGLKNGKKLYKDINPIEEKSLNSKLELLKEVKEEYRKHRKDKVFAQCWPANNDSFYEWCSQYLDYNHITKKIDK